MRWALVIGDQVATVIEQAGAPTAHLAGRWVADPAGRVCPGWVYDEVAFRGPQDPVPPPPVVSMRQARRALHAAGLLTSVEAAIDALPEPTRTAARIDWDYSNELQRSHPLVAQLSAALALSGEQLDALFTAAAAL